MGKKARGGRRAKRENLFSARPFDGVASETTWVALRELVPAATAQLRLAGEYADRDVRLVTVLPMAYPALVKPDGRILLAAQTSARSGDLSRDLAATLLAAFAVDPGVYVSLSESPSPGPRLQDLLADDPVVPTLHETFGFWLDDAEPTNAEVAESLERANASILPTEAMSSAPDAYWCQVPDRTHVRWVLPEAEDEAWAALSRVSAAGALTMGPGSRYAGAFRAHGLLIPVFDTPVDAKPADLESALVDLAAAYGAAVAETGELSSAARQAGSVLRARQLTLR